MEGIVINDRYKAVRELKPARDGKIYWVVEDQQKGKEKWRWLLKRTLLGNELKMLKGIALFDEKQEEEAKLEVDLLRRLGSGLSNFMECYKRTDNNRLQTILMSSNFWMTFLSLLQTINPTEDWFWNIFLEATCLSSSKRSLKTVDWNFERF